MDGYFRLVAEELSNQLNQIRYFVKKHNPTIGILTEEILRNFLKTHLPKSVSVEQGFIMSHTGELSKQCDILIYDSQRYAPFYRLNDIVIVPKESVLAVIEVKTKIDKQKFHNAINYFANINSICHQAKSYLFVYESCDINKLKEYFHSYKHKGEYQLFDHDTYELLPDEITGIDKSYHLEKNYVCLGRDMVGYDSFYYENEEGYAISALELFYLSVYRRVENYISNNDSDNMEEYTLKREVSSYFAIGLFDM